MKDKKDGHDDTIKIFLRIKPSNKQSRNYQIDKDFDHDVLKFHMVCLIVHHAEHRVSRR